MGEYRFAATPSALYGFILLMAGFSYWLLQNCIVKILGSQSAMAAEIGKDAKGKLSLLLYIIGIAATFWNPWISQAIYVIAALIWLIPDPRLEKAMSGESHSEKT